MTIKPYRELPVKDSLIRVLLPGLTVVLCGVIIAFLIYLINQAFPEQPEKVVKLVGILFLIIFSLTVVIYSLSVRRRISPGGMGVVVLTIISVLLVAIYIYRVSFFVRFPADILLWSESDFVNDILKFKIGYPIYSPQVNSESFMYTPGAQILTYLIALPFSDASIPLWRFVQLVYVFIASVVSVLSCQMLINDSLSKLRSGERMLWYAFLLPFFFLISTNSVTNPYVQFLHNDALALLISSIAYFLLLKYMTDRNIYILVLMALIPGAGFLVKQSLAIWAFLYCIYIVLFDKPRSIIRIFVFSITSFGSVILSIAGCYIIWGDDFIYWCFLLMGKESVSLLRSFQHIMDAWVYFVAGLFGGLVLIIERNRYQLVGAWVIGMLLILIEGYTSGLGWMLNHMGPGSLIAGMWFTGAVIAIWIRFFAINSRLSNITDWLCVGIIVAIISFVFNGLGFVRMPLKPLPDDTYRYVRDIEKEFDGVAVDRVLLDGGTWVYYKKGIVMKDRGLSFVDRGLGETGDFSGMIKRLRQKYYSKILVRNLDAPNFIYDYWLWPKSSGIRHILLDNYKVAGYIKEVHKSKHYEVPYYFFDKLAILVPKSD